VTPAAEALLARVYGTSAVAITPAGERFASLGPIPRKHPLHPESDYKSASQNLGIPRPAYDLAENRNTPHGEKQWRGN
jgi:hypothetical protein